MSSTAIFASRWAARALPAAAFLWSAAAHAGSGADAIGYNRDIRPILAENCFACHGRDAAARKAGLRLDVRENALKKDVIVPGKPEKSAFIERINATDAAEIMPPPKSHKKLTTSEKELLRRWIAAGAEYQPHWSFVTPTRHPVPAVKNAAWVRNPIDAFLLAEMEKRGLAPAPEADRRTLARRASFDITGLPPAIEDVEAFVNDKAPDAYERYLDKLFASPAWGEHRGRFWLDAARYADTHGIHFDNFREMWTYRDWVINAFNRNMPFDQFTVEQIAGDLLPNRTMDQQIASGFNRCNITTNEGGAINEEYLVLYARDRTETTSQVFLGLTTGCAVCHDHKFDPFNQKDFYSLAAFFNNTTQNAMDGNIKDTPPILFVARAEDRERFAKISGEREEVRKAMEARRQSARPDFDKWFSSLTPEKWAELRPAGLLRAHAALNEGKDKKLKFVIDGKPREITGGGVAWENARSRKDDKKEKAEKAEKAEKSEKDEKKPVAEKKPAAEKKSAEAAAKAFKSTRGGTVEVGDIGDFDRDQAFSYGAWLKIPNTSTGAAFSRMDDQKDFRGWDLWLEGGKPGTHIVNKWPDDALKVVAKKPLEAGKWHHVLITYDGSGKAAGVKIYVDGAEQPFDVQADKLKGTIRTTVPFKLAQRSSTSRIDNLGIEDLRLYGGALSAADAGRLAKGQEPERPAPKAIADWTAAEKEEAFSWWLTAVDTTRAALAEKSRALEKEEAEIKARGTVAHVMQEKPGEAMAYVLFRGEYDKRRDKVTPNTPLILPAMPADLPRNRLGLAKWLMLPEHPLTARVTVNRFWQEVFGTGIVRTAGDFGATGEPPSHPELLDWLAVEFREGGWDVKRFFKLLLTSSAYRQAAVATPDKIEKDPANRLLSRGPRFRMDAEMIRDNALAVGGLLVRKIGGPSVKPYQPDGVWEAVAMIGSNTRDYKRDAGENLYRRSMYTFWKRAAPPASMEILNAPAREFCTVRRERTNTPLQALVTLNDVQFVEAARNLAQLVMKDGGATPDTRIDYLAKRVLSRPLRAEEAKIVRGVFDQLLAHYQAEADAARKLVAFGESKFDPALNAAELAAWTMTANELMNLDEVLNK